MKYDGNDRTPAVTEFLAATTQSRYDLLGNLLDETDALGRVKRYTCNVAGELAEVIEPNDSGDVDGGGEQTDG